MHLIDISFSFLITKITFLYSQINTLNELKNYTEL